MCSGLGLTREGDLAMFPRERDQRCVWSVSASQHSATSTRTLPRSGPSSSAFAERALNRMPPVETGEPSVSRRSVRFGGSCDAVGACSSNFPQVLPEGVPVGPRATCDRASDAPVATPLDTGTAFSRAFRGTRGPIRTRSPRPLRPRRREATRPSPVRDAFDRQRMRCSYSAPSSGDCATDSRAERTTHAIRRIFPGPAPVALRAKGPGCQLFVARGSPIHA